MEAVCGCGHVSRDYTDQPWGEGMLEEGLHSGLTITRITAVDGRVPADYLDEQVTE
jgi:hypothetical protein